MPGLLSKTRYVLKYPRCSFIARPAGLLSFSYSFLRQSVTMLKIALRATPRSNHVGHSKLRRSWAGQATSYLIAWALSLAAPTASNRAYASDQIKVTIYRLSEQD